jgi:uncharacterized protein YkwD
MNSWTIFISVFLMACAPRVNGQPRPSHSDSQCDASKTELRIFYLLNQERELAGLKKLEWNTQAAEAARAHASLLAEHEALSHQFAGESPLRDRLAAAEVRFTSAAENVALADNEDEAHLALMYSSGHRENILNKNYSAVGVGAVEHNGRLYVTQDFVRLVPVYSEEQFQDALTKVLNSARQTEGKTPMLVKKDTSLHQAACATDGRHLGMPVASGFSGELVAFTLSEPEQLPAEFLKRASSARLIKLGVCFRPDRQYGNGNFWIVATLGR